MPDHSLDLVAPGKSRQPKIQRAIDTFARIAEAKALPTSPRREQKVGQAPRAWRPYKESGSSVGADQIAIFDAGPKQVAVTAEVTASERPHKLHMTTQPDHLDFALHEGGSRLLVRFCDGRSFHIDLSRQLGIRRDMLRMPTATVSSRGTEIEIKDKRGRRVPIDGSTLRAACDPEYAAQMHRAFAAAYAEAASELQEPPPRTGETPRILRLPAAKQRRLEVLGEKNNEGTLNPNEHKEYAALSREVDLLTLENAMRLAGRR
jgi:hypothetical protein